MCRQPAPGWKPRSFNRSIRNATARLSSPQEGNKRAVWPLPASDPAIARCARSGLPRFAVQRPAKGKQARRSGFRNGSERWGSGIGAVRLMMVVAALIDAHRPGKRILIGEETHKSFTIGSNDGIYGAPARGVLSFLPLLTIEKGRARDWAAAFGAGWRQCGGVSWCGRPARFPADVPGRRRRSYDASSPR